MSEIIKRIDDLGRVVVPQWIREDMGVSYGSQLAMEYRENDKEIVFKRYEPECCICHTAEKIVIIDHTAFCPSCLKHVAKEASKLPSQTIDE